MRFLGYYKSSLADGIGWRTVLFVSGCNHHCPGCHNPESWDKNYGKVFDEEDYKKLCAELSKKEIRGLTLSGGDPLLPDNRDDVLDLVRNVKKDFPNKDIWLYTGYMWDEVKDLEIMLYIDVLVDGPFIQEERDTTIAFRGSRNQRIIDVEKSLKDNKVVEIDYE